MDSYHLRDSSDASIVVGCCVLSLAQGGLPLDESNAAKHAVAFTWDAAKSGEGARLDGSGLVAHGTDGKEAWARARQGISAGRAYWQLKFRANAPRDTNKVWPP